MERFFKYLYDKMLLVGVIFFKVQYNYQKKNIFQSTVKSFLWYLLAKHWEQP